LGSCKQSDKPIVHHLSAKTLPFLLVFTVFSRMLLISLLLTSTRPLVWG